MRSQIVIAGKYKIVAWFEPYTVKALSDLIAVHTITLWEFVSAEWVNDGDIKRVLIFREVNR